jgi:rhodanese-related sulfurtransferase
MSDQPSGIGQPAAEEVDVGVAQALWAAGDPIVDVRTAQEYSAGHIAGALNVPLERLAFGLDDLPRGQVLTVCSMGNRSRQGADRLARLGRTALSLRGGTKAWAAAGLPIVTGPEPGQRRRSRGLLAGLRRLVRRPTR